MSTVPIQRNVENARVLLIGPQGENELYSAYSFGLRRKNITAIDLFSYSPRIDVGDMHDLPYEDNSFDIVVAGWVLAYSDDRPVAAREIARVCKPGAMVAVSASFHSDDNDTIIQKSGYLPGSEQRITCVADLNEPFGEFAGTMYFQQDLEPVHGKGHQHLISVFSVSK